MKRPGTLKIFLSVAIISLLCASSVFAHFTWIHPLLQSVQIGENVAVRMSTGHAFPESEQAPSLEYLTSYAVSPSGQKISLQFTEEEYFLHSSYTVGEQGLHTLIIESDRGVISRTTRGWQPGGKDQHPHATSSMNLYTSALSHVYAGDNTPNGSEPIGLKFELTFTIERSRIVFIVYRNSQPLAGAEISVVKTGSRNAEPIGTTDSSGQLSCSRNDLTDEVLFIAQFRQDAPAGSNYDTDLMRSTLYLNLK
jgi:uncharacterized GH25 family protein